MKLFQNKSVKKYLPFLFLISIVCAFFYKTVVFGKVPIAGDLLLSQYTPWRHESYQGYVAGTVPTKNQYFDVIRELYPWKTLVVGELKQGHIPLWNPYNFSGAPLLGNYQSQVFYPLGILYMVLPQILAWTILVILQPLLGTMFFYLFASEIGIGTVGALIAALLFNFSGFMNVWMEFTTVGNTIIWLPLLLFLVERRIKTNTFPLRNKLLFIFALFSSITGGHPQDFIYLFLFLVFYIVIRVSTISSWGKKEKIVVLLQLGAASLVALFLAAPQLLPTAELFQHSARVAHDSIYVIEKMLIQWWQLPILVVQDFFGNPATNTNFTGDYVVKAATVGVCGFLMALVGCARSIRTWHKKFFLGTAVIVALLLVRSPVSELLYHFSIPIVSTGTPTRIAFLFSLALSILAGFGYDALQKKSFSLKLFLFCVGIVFATLWAFVLFHPTITGLSYLATSLSIMKRALLLSSLIVVAFICIILVSRIKNSLLFLLLPLCVFELFYAFNKFNPFVSPSFIYPENKLITYLQKNTGINRFWGYGTANVEANFATQTHLYSPDGTDPLNIALYNQFLQSSNDGNLALTFTRSTRSDAKLAPGYGESNLPQNIFRLRVMDMLGVKYIIDRSENPKDATTFSSTRFKELWHEDDWTVFENLLAAPRFFLTSDVQGYTDNKGFEEQFFSSSFNPKSTILVEKTELDRLPKLEKTEGTVALLTYEPSLIRFHVASTTKTMLFISDTYDPGWRATVNGKTTPVIKTNYAFRSVLIPPGQSIVELKYQPKSFVYGCIISFSTFTGLFIYLTFVFFQKRQQRKQ